MSTSPFAALLAQTAYSQYTAYKNQHETDPGLSQQIRTYWTDLGMHFPGVDTAWSAVFVSWCVWKAGASRTEFLFSAQHSEFVKFAIGNTNAGAGVFRGRKLSDYAPKVGDIVQNNRPVTPRPAAYPFDYNYAASHGDYSSHSAIVVEQGTDHLGSYIATIGGNESDSVGYRVIRLTDGGLIQQPSADPQHFICIIEDKK